MAINYNQPIFTIGREPLVAGTIVARNNLRLRKQRERRRRWNKLTAGFVKFEPVPKESRSLKAIAPARFALNSLET